jgi:hypothetical protein
VRDAVPVGELPRKNRSAAAAAEPQSGVIHQETAMHFRITGLPADLFTPLFSLSDAELAARGAVRRIADAKPGFPCRVSLTDAEPGQPVILTHFEHHAVASPFRASHAIYVRSGERQFDAIDQIPEQLRLRMLSLRGFDRDGMLVAADLVDGKQLEAGIEQLLGNDRAAYLHAHYAKPGCYAARIERAA